MYSRTLKSLYSAVALAAALPLAANQANVDSLKKEFAGVRALELPSRAASVVAAAKPEERASTASDVVSAAMAVNASAGPMVVGSISRVSPDSAAHAAVTATAKQPGQLAQITRAAVGASPSQAEPIVNAMTKAHPTSFFTIGVSAADVAPKSGDAILRGIGQAVPALKTLIAKANPQSVPAKDPATVAAILKRAQGLLATVSKQSNVSIEKVLAGELTPEMTAKLPANIGPLALTGPEVQGPYTPGSPTPGEINTSQTFDAPTGGRNYSAP